ncbi:hypothetical protein TVAG_427470 [Trichomonas vaginalis G3]|uniref:Uncharacterized protein n=1 Tax=Trichomonas vaginalis (strain ATCC PRA-98 / G3) TaxID=412133 RepID=A2F666_TRIV3|nr:hypothetical protein TVAGG3_0660490 [Trichomonas vaginalis G3]EAX99583.1 hypothetical protein TVAG_427470 [Trichomonas vaginalis G3]KAI5506466.1 hypothetical protein TVAGG3_0660490 [Trichomonas vaginalis G3]|eukprot:XP_001312513.1 hypothetical protein [Trichomonas vaginalis G3]
MFASLLIPQMNVEVLHIDMVTTKTVPQEKITECDDIPSPTPSPQSSYEETYSTMHSFSEMSSSTPEASCEESHSIMHPFSQTSSFTPDVSSEESHSIMHSFSETSSSTVENSFEESHSTMHSFSETSSSTVENSFEESHSTMHSFSETSSSTIDVSSEESHSTMQSFSQTSSSTIDVSFKESHSTLSSIGEIGSSKLYSNESNEYSCTFVQTISDIESYYFSPILSTTESSALQDSANSDNLKKKKKYLYAIIFIACGLVALAVLMTAVIIANEVKKHAEKLAHDPKNEAFIVETDDTHENTNDDSLSV